MTERSHPAAPAALSVQPLLDAIDQYAIPNAQRDDCALVVAQPTLREFGDLHQSVVEAIPRELRGPRVDITSPASNGSAVSTAQWREDGLESKRFPLLCYVLDGHAAIQIADYELHCPAGCFVFVPPGIPHPDGSVPHLQTSGEHEFCDLLWLYRWEGGLICHICHSKGVHHWNVNESEICFVTGTQSLHYFDLMAEEVLSGALDNGPIYQRLLPILLMILQRDLQAGHFIREGINDTSAVPRLLPGEDPIIRAQTYIRSHLDQDLTIDKIAHMVFMSRSHFTKQFRRTTGTSFTDFLTAARIEKAKTLLRDTDWPVEVICLRIGLRPSHLWALFREHVGLTPGKYRESQHKS